MQDTDFIAFVNPTEAIKHLLQYGDSSLINEICESWRQYLKLVINFLGF